MQADGGVATPRKKSDAVSSSPAETACEDRPRIARPDRAPRILQLRGETGLQVLADVQDIAALAVSTRRCHSCQNNSHPSRSKACGGGVRAGDRS